LGEPGYRAEASNDVGQSIERDGVRNGREAQRWALEKLPDVSRLVLRNAKGQSKGHYVRPGGTGDWQDADIWAKSV
jgi:hypothetical protein